MASLWTRNVVNKSGPLLIQSFRRHLSTINVTFIAASGEKKDVDAKIGQSLLDVAKEHDIELEGACEGSLACSTCHVILTDEAFDSLPEPTDEENDLLDMAYGLTETSRLGCQVCLTEDMDKMEFHIPAATRNLAVDGYVPPKH